MYLIGLTGNIACGKSTVLRELERRGAAVIDADQVTRMLQEPGQAVYMQIVETFGPGILVAPAGPIDRKALAAIVFNDPAALHRLEALVHPAVRSYIFAWLDKLNKEESVEHKQIAVIDAIKLLESGWKARVDAVWVVTSSFEQQLQRLVATRGMAESEARIRIAAQPAQSEKIAQADVVIDNSGTLEETMAQIDAAWTEAVGR